MHEQADMACISLDFISMFMHLENCHLLTNQVQNGDFAMTVGRAYLHSQRRVRFVLALVSFILDL